MERPATTATAIDMLEIIDLIDIVISSKKFLVNSKGGQETQNQASAWYRSTIGRVKGNVNGTFVVHNTFPKKYFRTTGSININTKQKGGLASPPFQTVMLTQFRFVLLYDD